MIPFAIPEVARTEEIANLVWDLFVSHGVLRNDHESSRRDFLWSFQNHEMWEYRIGGWMSFGCKFRGGTWQVDIYPENRTEETDAILQSVNDALSNLAREVLSDDWKPTSGYSVMPFGNE